MTPDEQLRSELELLVQRHAEFSRRLESILAELQASPFATPVAPESLPSRSLTPADVARELSRLDDRIARMEEQLDAATRQLELNSTRIQEVLDSRIWKIFTGIGGILLRLVGQR